MSGSSPFGEGFDFGSMMANLAKFFSTEGSINWEVARQLASWVSNEGQSEENVDPTERIRLEELIRVAELHVQQFTSLDTSPHGELLKIRPLTRSEWASETLKNWSQLLEALAHSLNPKDTPDVSSQVEPDAQSNPFGSLFGDIGGISSLLSPVFLGMQSGAMVGYLAQKSFGQYSLPIPGPKHDELIVIASNITSFAKDWSLSADDTRMWVCLSETVHHGILSIPHISTRLNDLLNSYVSGFNNNSGAIQERLSQIDPLRPESFQETLGDPTALLGAIQSPSQLRTLSQIQALLAAIEGYTDYVLDNLGSKLITSYSVLSEASKRRRVEQGQGDQLVGKLFGIELNQALYEKGRSFIEGIIERAGEEKLQSLFGVAKNLPTPSEIDAPGLWLERISLPEQ